MIAPTNKVTPFICFDKQAEAAANSCVSLFANLRIVDVARWGEGAPFPSGSAMSATFELDGRQHIGFNGGPHFKLRLSAAGAARQRIPAS